MQTKFVAIGDIQLAYSEKNASANHVIFFVHGNSGSKRSWRKQFESELLNMYHLIAFDLPGCGQSVIGGDSNWDYSPLATGEIITRAILELSGSKSYSLVGFSYGSNIVAETFNQQTLRPKAVSLLAPCVVGSNCAPDIIFTPGDYIFFHDELSKGAVADFFSAIFLSGEKNDIEIAVEDFFFAKPPFRSALIQSIGNGRFSDEIALLKGRNIPVQVIFGNEDKLLQINYLDNLPFPVWERKIYKVPGAAHYVHCDQPEMINRLLSEYLREALQ